MMKKIIILGSTGMLGNAVTSHFLSKKDKYEVVATYRNKAVAFSENDVFFDALTMDFSQLPADADYLINCIGVIKPFMSQSIENAITINALFPWKLSEWCENNNIRLIHITTDCVYSGKKGEYTESDLHDALDEYGKSKSLGECISKAMVLRTSIIGEEIHKNASLIAWAKSQKGKHIKGFTKHLWNGITSKKYAEVCDEIIEKDMYEKGLFHIHAADDVSKYQMMEYFNEKYNLDLQIEAVAPELCNRTLRTEKELCKKLCIPSVKQMIEEI